MTLQPLNVPTPSYPSHLSESTCSQPMDESLHFVICRVCGERLKTISQRHLNKHGITIEDYRRLFPDAPVHSIDYLKNHSEATKRNMAKPEYKARLSASAKSQWAKMRDRMSRAIREGVSKRGELKICVDCGKPFHAKSPHEQHRCPRCYELYRKQYSYKWYKRRYHIWHHILKESMEEFAKENDDSILPFSHTGFMNDVGTDGTPAMNLTILPNGRIAGAVYLETGKIPSLKGLKQTSITPKTPWRRRLPESSWQHRIMENCPDCGTPNMLVYLENPHCMECGAEIVFADENRIYSVKEFACSKCGLVDNGVHFIFKCQKCDSEFRCRVEDNEISYVRVQT